MGVSTIDWQKLEEVIEKAIRRSRVEELRDFTEAIKILAGYVKKGYEVLEEHSKRIEELSKRIEEHSKRLEEHSRRIEEMNKILEKHSKILEEHSKRIEELSKRIEEHSKRLEEHSRRIEELTKRVEEQSYRLEEVSIAIKEHSKRLEDLGRLVTVIANRFGVLSEESFRAGMRYVVEEVFGVAKVEKWVYRDDEGFVHGVPAIVEVDVVIRDKEHILVEVKSRVSKGDISELSKIGKLYEKIEKIRPRLAIIGGFIDKGVKELAENLGVEIIPILTPYS